MNAWGPMLAVAAWPFTLVALVMGGRRIARPARQPSPGSDLIGQVASTRPRRSRRRVGRWWGVGGVAVLAVAAGPVTAAGGAVFVFAVWPRWRAVRAGRVARRTVGSDLADTTDLLVALVRAGLSPLQSMTVLAQRAPPSWRPGFAAVEAARSRGLRYADALDELITTLGPAARGIAHALASADRYGHPIAPVLERLSDEGRADRRRHAEADARRLPVRLSFPLVCCTLPSFVLLTVVPLLGGAFSSLSSSGGPP